MMFPSIRRSLPAALAVLAAAAFAAGCGSSDDGGETSAAAGGDAAQTTASEDLGYPAEFAEIVERAKKPVSEWPGPTESPRLARGQFVFAIPCSKVAEGCQRIVDGVKSAADAVGWRFATVDPAGDPNRQGAAIEQAINAGATVIVLAAIEPKLVADPLKRARARGIRVICTSCGHENDREYFTDDGIQADVSLRGTEQGEIMGAFLATDSDGKAKVGMIESPEFPLNVERAVATKAALKQCAGCEVVAQTDFLQTEIGTQLGSKSQTFFQANPSIEYGWVAFDAAAGAVVPAAQQAGAAQMRIVSFDANVANIEFVEKGAQYATVGTALEWVGWAAVDEANRLLNGEEALASDNVPNRLVTEENAAEYAKTGFRGDIDYEAKYLELWRSGSTDTSAQPAG